MIINEEILKDGMTDIILAKLIARHASEQERFERLYNYYIGKHAICERRRSSDNIANKSATMRSTLWTLRKAILWEILCHIPVRTGMTLRL